MFKKTLILSTFLLTLAACSPSQSNSMQAGQAAAESAVSSVQEPSAWHSSSVDISFLSSKINKQLNSITEQSGFGGAQATLGKEGDFKMDVDLGSVKTGIEIRDQRLKDWVFETARFAKAEISAKVDAEAVNNLSVGESVHFKQPLVLNIHGKQINLEADLSAQRVSADKMMVYTLSPVVLDTKSMDMADGVAKLVEVMGLSSIVEQIPVSLHAEFVRRQ
ncbi:YceI family protein [Neisseria musculi]|uniref:YceI family protein n=1 Tax=Neisseria musculi TaxID=1815583 RepID=A0A7H1M985_9NEIS|nr:YceI family protein [Neisseria musculi]QNT58200.1 yceI family protein [Neisseria musculi]